MNKDLLLQIFKAPYNRQSFIDNVLLPTVQGKVDDLEIYDQYGAQEVGLTASESQYAKSAVKYGEFTTRDEIGRTVELYEVVLHDHKQVERSRVGIAALIKKQIIGNNAVLVNFAYENPQNRSWRFSFIAHDAIFADGEMVQSETNPKRYTYVFGEPSETYRTALDRFYTLGHEYSISIESLKDAFGVEAMSKAFFDEYRDIHYNGFVDYLTRSNFKQSVFNGDEKAISNFVKKLLGRIVFLYFIQKKGWLGASNGNYKDGDKNFMSNFYKKAGANEVFYSTWLSKLFFDTLNNPRPNDAFEMPDGTSVMIPYLNGGLFEKESNKYDFLTFPTDLFSGLFEFFDQYNFTIYEDSPEEHTVAVDPEMLGHIFENLLEDNKDKGAFYTPKEIVHYMTQESLIEYLHTQIPDANRNELEAFVKIKDNNLSEQHKKQIDQKLDAVKICDPAIGSGAFPMGLLQEIFGMKERIAYELGYTSWSPATVKEHIIQNSIYGVDIEQGAVDIARLRFWLSLIVDENMPKALPNLDYKIVVGNSLVSKFEDEIIEIDWSTDDTSGGLFGQEIIAEKTKLLQTISDKQKDFFTADNDYKPKLSAEIRKLKLDILAKQLELMIETKGAKRDSNALKKPSKKQLEKYLETEGWKRTLSKIKQLKANEKPFKHFDWKLDFPEVLNPLATTNTGFDIVIGNPPYGVSIKGKYREEVLKIFGKVPDYEIYYFFTELAFQLTLLGGVKSFIIPNTFLFNTYAAKYRLSLLERWQIVEIMDCTKFNIFQTATVRNAITLWKKSQSLDIGYRRTRNINSFSDLLKVERQLIASESLLNMNQNWGLAFMLSKESVNLVSQIKSNRLKLLDLFPDVSQGLIAYDRYRGQSEEIIKSRAYHYKSNDKEGLKRWLWGADVTRYKVEWNNEEYIDYCDGIANPRDPKFFRGERMLIREITNPTVFAGLTDEELYNDPAIIIVKSNETYSVKALVGLMNSKLATYYHFNNSPKATKGAFPKILVQDIKDFPLPMNIMNSVLKLLVDYMLVSKQYGISEIEQLEDVIDSVVFELYFSNQFQSKSVEIEKHVKEIFTPIEGLSDKEKLEQVKSVYEELREKKNPLRNQIKLMKIELKDLLNPILSV